VVLGIGRAQERIALVPFGSEDSLKEPTRIGVVIDNEYSERTHAFCLPFTALWF
jgi:hypothetical protein